MLLLRPIAIAATLIFQLPLSTPLLPLIDMSADSFRHIAATAFLRMALFLIFATPGH
jgi:hypothetical protein